MTRHENAAVNRRIDNRRMLALAVVIGLLLAASFGMLLGPNPTVAGALAPWPIPAEESEPTPHPSFGPIAPIFPDVTPVPHPDDPTEATSAPAPAPPAASSAPARTTAAPAPAATRTTAAPVPAQRDAGGGEAAPAEPAGPPPNDGSVLGLVNVARWEAGCGPVVADATLDAFAASWSAELAVRDPAENLAPSDHSGGPYAENIAFGYPDAASVMAGWMGSAGHRENIETCGHTRMGIASAAGPSGLYWTQVFA